MIINSLRLRVTNSIYNTTKQLYRAFSNEIATNEIVTKRFSNKEIKEYFSNLAENCLNTASKPFYTVSVSGNYYVDKNTGEHVCEIISMTRKDINGDDHLVIQTTTTILNVVFNKKTGKYELQERHFESAAKYINDALYISTAETPSQIKTLKEVDINYPISNNAFKWIDADVENTQKMRNQHAYVEGLRVEVLMKKFIKEYISLTHELVDNSNIFNVPRQMCKIPFIGYKKPFEYINQNSNNNSEDALTRLNDLFKNIDKEVLLVFNSESRKMAKLIDKNSKAFQKS